MPTRIFRPEHDQDSMHEYQEKYIIYSLDSTPINQTWMMLVIL